MNDVEEAILEGGQDLEIRGGEAPRQERGLKNGGAGTFLFGPGVRVRAGEWVVDEYGAEYYVTEIGRIVDEGQLLGFKAHYKTRAQHEADLAASRPSNTSYWTVGDVSNSNLNAGVQGNIDMRASYDFRSIEQLIDRQADPAQAPEFRAALEEIRGQIERDGAIKGGSLRKFNDLMRDAGWFTGPLAGLVMQFLVGNSV